MQGGAFPHPVRESARPQSPQDPPGPLFKGDEWS